MARDLQWPTVKDVAFTVVKIFNEKVPVMGMYRGRQSGWPMTIEDILEPSQQRIHADARHMVTLIMAEEVCLEKGVERRRLMNTEIARLMKRSEGVVRQSKRVALYLMEQDQEYASVHTQAIGALRASGFRLCQSFDEASTQSAEDERRP